jgi:hypothetical protein
MCDDQQPGDPYGASQPPFPYGYVQQQSLPYQQFDAQAAMPPSIQPGLPPSMQALPPQQPQAPQTPQEQQQQQQQQQLLHVDHQQMQLQGIPPGHRFPPPMHVGAPPFGGHPYGRANLLVRWCLLLTRVRQTTTEAVLRCDRTALTGHTDRARA